MIFRNSLVKLIRKVISYEVPKTVACEVCGCLVNFSLAVKGESLIKVAHDYNSWEYQPDTNKFKYEKEKEYLYTPYYCRVHAPKTEEKIEKQQPLIPDQIYSTRRDVRKAFDNALSEDNFHVCISRIEKGELVTDCFLNGNITTENVAQGLLKSKKSSIDKRNIHTYKEKVGGKTFVGAFEVKDYSQDFPSCSCTSMEPWERPECRYCIHYDASDFERWKEEKVKGADYVEPYGVSCRNIERALKEEREV